jgi:hypothetical protein
MDDQECKEVTTDRGGPDGNLLDPIQHQKKKRQRKKRIVGVISERDSLNNRLPPLPHGVCNRVPVAGEIACQCKYVTEHRDIQKMIRESYSLFVANSTEGNPGNELLVTFIVPKRTCDEGRYGKNVVHRYLVCVINPENGHPNGELYFICSPVFRKLFGLGSGRLERLQQMSIAKALSNQSGVATKEENSALVRTKAPTEAEFPSPLLGAKGPTKTELPTPLLITPMKAAMPQNEKDAKLILADRLCFVEIQKKPQNANENENDASTTSCWWPAVLYESPQEFQSCHQMDNNAEVALSIQLMKQYCERSERSKCHSGQAQGGRTTPFVVARLLGRPLSELQIIGPDEKCEDYHLFLQQIVGNTSDPTAFFSETEYLNFHKGLDEAASILINPMTMNEEAGNDDSNTTPPTPLVIDGFYQLAMKALTKDEAKTEVKGRTPIVGLVRISKLATAKPASFTPKHNKDNEHQQLIPVDASCARALNQLWAAKDGLAKDVLGVLQKLGTLTVPKTTTTSTTPSAPLPLTTTTTSTKTEQKGPSVVDLCSDIAMTKESPNGKTADVPSKDDVLTKEAAKTKLKGRLVTTNKETGMVITTETELTGPSIVDLCHDVASKEPPKEKQATSSISAIQGPSIVDLCEDDDDSLNQYPLSDNDDDDEDYQYSPNDEEIKAINKTVLSHVGRALNKKVDRVRVEPKGPKVARKGRPVIRAPPIIKVEDRPRKGNSKQQTGKQKGPKQPSRKAKRRPTVKPMAKKSNTKAKIAPERLSMSSRSGEEETIESPGSWLDTQEDIGWRSVPRRQYSKNGRSVLPHRTPWYVGKDFHFYLGIEQVPQLAHIGVNVVHNVKGNGHCGFYCLILALAVIDFDLKNRPLDHLEMRRRLFTFAPRAQADMFGSESEKIFPGMDEAERLKDWSSNMTSIFDDSVDYGDEDFMREVDAESGEWVNSDLWMEATFVLPIFAKCFRLRVVFYHIVPGRCVTSFYNGVDGNLKIDHKEGLLFPPHHRRTVGIVLDSSHFRYVDIERPRTEGRAPSPSSSDSSG